MVMMNSKVISTLTGILISLNQFACDANNFNCDNEMLTECKCWELKDNYIVDCSNTGVKSVPEGIPIRTTHLYLNNNGIKILHNNSFVLSKSGLPNLVTLSIRSNAMSKVEIKALKGLLHLRELDLYNNSLKCIDSYPESIFVPISQSLEVLDIRRNLLEDVTEMDYPISVRELVGLKELRIDCIRNKSLPTEYGKLRNLTKLSFTGGSKKVGFIRDDMFKAVSKAGITDVNLGALEIELIGNDTFSNLPNLRTLDLSNNPYVIIYVKNIISSLKETAILSLKLNNTGIGEAESTTQILKTLGELHLKELTLDNNGIQKLDPRFSDYLPHLEVLSLGNNLIDFDMNLWSHFYKLKHLTGLNMSWQNQNTMKSNRFKMPGEKLHRIKTTKPLHYCDPGLACPVTFPPKIQWIDISHMGKGVYFPGNSPN